MHHKAIPKPAQPTKALPSLSLRAARSTKDLKNTISVHLPRMRDFEIPAQKAWQLAKKTTAEIQQWAEKKKEWIQKQVKMATDKAREQHEKRGKDTLSPKRSSAYLQFTEGSPVRPSIHHDHGFLDDGTGKIDDSKRRPPTEEDYEAFAKWLAMLEGAELLRPDMIDATAAYRHFLFGNGRDRGFDYNRFLEGDSSGERIGKSLVEDTCAAAIELHDKMKHRPSSGERVDTFSITSDVLGAGPIYDEQNGTDRRYPYPATENWQKTIGAHFIWVDGQVNVRVDPAAKQRHFSITMTVHVEDMYNFNPGASDIATAVPDSENGRFELTGIGHEFLHYSTIERTITCTAGTARIARPRKAARTAQVVSRSPLTATPPDSRR